MRYAYRGRTVTPSVDIAHDLIPYIAGISEHSFYMDAEKCADAWEKATDVLGAFFGDYRSIGAPFAAPLSYGHLISIGTPYTLPQDSEPNVRAAAHSIDEAIAIARDAQGIDFGDNDLCRHYMNVNRCLQRRFPSFSISPLAGYGSEGLLTSAVLLRGQDLFMDLYDEPEKVHEFFSLLNQSVIDFVRWVNRTAGRPEVSETGAYLADDFAALVPPSMWEEFIVPYWNDYYAQLTTAPSRFLHCEGLYPQHLKYLQEVGLTHFQPSVSPNLTLESVRANTGIPFDWLLYMWQVTEMSDAALQDWVDAAVEAGVSIIRTQIGKFTWMHGRQDRILAFYRAFDKYRVD